MYSLSAFMTMSAMANNTPGSDSPIGELSTTSATMSREVGKYTDSSAPDVRLLSFSSVDGNTGNKIPVAPLYSSKVLQMGQFLFENSIDGTLSDNKDACQQAVESEFNGVFEVLVVGSMVTNGNYYLPEYIFVKELSSSDDNVLRIWFSDPAFRAQYDLHELVVVPPIATMDDFHKDRATVLALIEGINIPGHLAEAQELTKDSPETLLTSRNYEWVDKIDDTIRYATPWTVAIYGLSGNNEDVIRQALVDYILAHSAHPREDWEVIFPDLFRPTEFYISPVWDRYSLPNQQTIGGLYSPTIPHDKFLSYGKQVLPNPDEGYLETNLVSAATVFKGLMFVSVGNPRNREDLFRFDVLWPQYINLSTTNIDFNRVPPETQEFILFLIELLVVAETLTEYSELPVGASRVERDGKTFLAKSLGSVLYLISVKANGIDHEAEV